VLRQASILPSRFTISSVRECLEKDQVDGRESGTRITGERKIRAV